MAPKKAQKMSLGDFLGDQSLGSWADEMEDVPLPSGNRDGGGYGGVRSFSSQPGFGGGDRSFERRDGYAVREQLPLPNKPPYTAHLGNLSYDATEPDVHQLFEDCAVTHVRIIEDKVERKPKGFGYVEFATLDGLKKALDISGTPFQGRNIKVTVAEPPKERSDRPEPRVLDDWTRKGPLPDLPGQNQRRASERGFGRNFDNQSDAGSEAGGERRRRGPPPFEGEGRSRDFGNWERKGPLSPLPGGGPPREGGRVRPHDGPPRERKVSPNWGERSERSESSRPPRPDRQPTAAEMDTQWRTKMRPDAPTKSPVPTPEASTPSSPAATPAAPATRPKLNLAKRTVSEAAPQTNEPSDSKASPFGAARPIDTATREREVEERRVKERQEAEAKAKAEKKAREDAAKAEKEQAEAEATNEEASEATSPTGPSSKEKENGSRPTPGLEVLQNEGEEGEEKANGNSKEAPQQRSGPRPQQGSRDVPIRNKSSEQSSWRRGPGPKPQPQHRDRNNNNDSRSNNNEAKEADSEGWSTVSTQRGRGGRGRGGRQAVAS